ncbi:GGDEF domain-containing protein [Psychrobium sp. 1_MG-2023]|uniref:GGDEF domain-containing protein n=1 Tax=Psychrobium sp. 1_MG-2023 TaxID=3062624 RepID=UPI000C34EF86|nr:GGDEF domain-containing protein [Psychrobium sp. 1_MG-2023]MDP2561450.1 GGDEF domain-containing protein [Psychrobium sp. 1_MG-2023]PKF57717.1 GGDEF domain-containing protein [Alteromonadales bacterium alter-6D02]
MDKELFVKSAANLKKAVPLMLKYQVPTTPTNYALWYTYVSNEIPELNSELDLIIEGHSVCPPIQAETLYRTFVADKVESSTWQMRENIEKMMLALNQSVKDTHKDTDKFQDSLDKTFSNLHRVEDEGWSIEEVMVLIRELEGDSKAIRQATQFFSASLTKANQEIDKLKQELEQSQKQALYDSLTGLLNRFSFDTELSYLLNKNNEGLCLILADIDHFKKFNDDYGHLLGDQVLKSVGRRLLDAQRDGALAYRFGGEEFAILIPKSSLRKARQYAETLRKLVDKLSLRDKRSNKQIDHINASFGVAEFQKGDTLTSFIARADEHLYKAKELGRNRVMPM